MADPPVRFRYPSSDRISVVLPAPLGPSKPKTSPRATRIEQSDNAWKSPYVFDSLSHDTIDGALSEASLIDVRSNFGTAVVPIVEFNAMTVSEARVLGNGCGTPTHYCVSASNHKNGLHAPLGSSTGPMKLLDRCSIANHQTDEPFFWQAKCLHCSFLWDFALPV